MTFRALRHRSFRLFWIGQGVSVSGTWMQVMAQSWLVFRLTDSPLALGLLSVSRFGPSLVGAPLAGVLADRVSRRQLVIFTQTASLVIASMLAALTLGGVVRVWQVMLLALCQGVVDTMDMTARQTLQVDLVGIEDLQSAVALNSAAFNVGRMAGPALAGVMVTFWNEGICFAFNAVSYLAVLAALLRIQTPPHLSRRGRPWRQEMLEGVRFAWTHPLVRATLLSVAVTSCAGLAYAPLLPVFSGKVIGAGARGYGLLLGGTGLGAILGALAAAGRTDNRGARLIMAVGQFCLGAGLVGLGLTRHLLAAVAIMVWIGLSVAVQLSTTNALLQTTAPPELRGRVVSLYIWLFAGLSPIGGLSAGWLAEKIGAPLTAICCGAACLAAPLLTGLSTQDASDESRSGP